MIDRTGRLLEGASRRLGGLRLREDEVVPGIVRFRISTRMTRVNGMEAAAYHAGTAMIDAGFAHAGGGFVPLLDRRRVSALVLTHHHEDHSGNAGAIAARHDCPIFLRNPGRRFEEGLSDLKPYRRIWWGAPQAYEPIAMPAAVDAGSETLRPVPIPGHSATHTALYAEKSGVVFTGDLYVTGGATAVMSHENPFESISSLRRVADLEPSWMLTGHAQAIERPSAVLRRKADAIEKAAARVLSLHAGGTAPEAIVRLVFPRGRAADRMIGALTMGEFSRLCFVLACVRHAR